jgi:DNA polymerase
MKKHAVAPRVRLDYETRSSVDLTKVGTWPYADHPRTHLLCNVFEIDGQYHVWTPTRRIDEDPVTSTGAKVEVHEGHAFPEPLAQAIRDGRELVAHNAEFECAITEHVVMCQTPIKWTCTQAMLAYFQYPQSLDKGATALGFAGKMKDGLAVMKSFCIAHERTPDAVRLRKLKGAKAMGVLAGQTFLFNKADYADGDPCPDLFDDEIDVRPIDDLVRYCIQDVEQTVAIDDKLAAWYPEFEQEVWRKHLDINRRGVLVDLKFIDAIKRIQDQADATIRIDGETLQVDRLRSLPYVKLWLHDHGVLASLDDTVDKKFIEALLSRPDISYAVRAFLEARLDASRVSLARLGKIQDNMCKSDQRLRGQFRYYGTTTGRWSGWGAQLQSLPKPDKGVKTLDCIEAVESGDKLAVSKCGAKGSLFSALSACVPAVLVSDPGTIYCKSDWSQIEARGVLWLAEDLVHLEWWKTKDMYSEMATRLFGRLIRKCKEQEKERDIGKRTVLGCNFQQGEERFNEECVKNNIDLKALGLTAYQVIKGFRDEFTSLSHPRDGLWSRLQRAMITCVKTQTTVRDCRLIFRWVVNSVWVELPSGRDLIFHNAKVVVTTKKHKDKIYETESVLCRNHDGSEEEYYGGKLADNFVQALCRDIEAEAIVNLENAGFPIHFHEHDCLTVAVPEATADASQQAVEEILLTPPTWCRDFPLACESDLHHRYLK